MPKTSEDRMHLFGEFTQIVVMRGFEGAKTAQLSLGASGGGEGPQVNDHTGTGFPSH